MSAIRIEKDWRIIAFVVSGYIGTIVIATCLIDFIRNARKKHISKKMKYPTVIALVSALLYCIMVGFFRTNFVFHKLNFDADSLTCNLTFGISWFGYYLSKFSMYILFTFKIELVFGESAYAVNIYFLYCIRFICAIFTSIFILAMTIFLNSKEIITEHYSITLCTGDTKFVLNFENIAVMASSLTDGIVSGLLLWLFCSKLYKITSILYKMDDIDQILRDDIDNKRLQQLESQQIKSTILVCTSIISSVIFLFSGHYLSWLLRWLMPVDMIINSLCIYLMFKFSDNLYLLCCKWCINCCERWIFWCFMVKQTHYSSSSILSSSSQLSIKKTPKKQLYGTGGMM